MSSAETSGGIADGVVTERLTASMAPGAVSFIDSSERQQARSPAPAALPGEDALRRLVRLAACALGAPASAVAVYDESRIILAAGCGLPEPLPRGARAAILQLLNDPAVSALGVMTADGLVGVRGMPEGRTSDGPAFRAAMAVPLIGERGAALGAVCVLDEPEREWSQEEIATLRDLAALAVPHLTPSPRTVSADDEKERQIRFRSLVENSADIVAILSAGGTVVYVTPAVERVLGYTPESLTGQNTFSLTHPSDAARIMEGLARVLRGNDCRDAVECRIRHLDGSWRTFEVRTNNLLDDPSVEGIVVNARDITDVRDAKQTQRRLNAFLEATPDFVAIFDPHGRALSVNSAFRRIVGIEADDDLSAVTVTDLFPRSVTDLLLHEGIPTAIRDGVWAGETRLQTLDGREVPISQVMLSHKAAGGAVEFLSTLARDITEQKRAEAALRRSEEHFRSLIENALDIITVLDSEGVILFESPSVRRVLGYEPNELLGRNYFDLIHPGDVERARAAVAASVQSGSLTQPLEARVQHRDGSWRVLESVSESLLDDPAVAGVVVNSRDITERREAEDELHESREQLLQSQKMEAVGRLAGGSHTISTTC